MIVIIDVTRLVRRLKKGLMLTGIDRVSIAYIQQYGHISHALVRWCGRSWVLPRVQSAALFNWLMMPGPVLTMTLIILRGIFSNTKLKNQTNIFLLNTGHIGLGQSDYVRMIQNLGVKPIFFVHDLIPILYPEYSNPGEDIRYSQKMNYVLTHACGVIANSEATRHDLIDYANQTNQIMPKVKTALLASGIKRCQPMSIRPIDKPYFVVLSTIEPRKNHMLILHIWRNLIQQYGKQTPHLVVIGQRGWECENVLDLLDRSQFLNGFVTEVSHCHDADLVTYIHHSQALLFPSFIEGYGLPLIESLTLGVPAIVSDIPVFREIAGDIPEYIDPIDGKRWAEMIMQYTQPQSTNRIAQMARIEHYKAPTWHEHFVQIDAFLAELSD